MSSLAKTKALLKEFAGVLRSGVWILEGQAAETNEPLLVLFAGSEKQRAHISQLTFDETCTEHYQGKVYFWKILYLVRANPHRCNLAVIEGGRLHRFLYQSRRDFFLPTWLKTSVAIPLAVASDSYKTDLRRIRKCELTYEVSSDNEKIQDFYHELYRPAVNRSHGESTIEVDYESMTRALRSGRCMLLLVTKGGVSIAGMLIVLGKTPRLWAAGVSDGDPSYQRKCGAYAAVYHFSSHYLAEQGYKEMHLGMSRGFLNDGVLRFKNKWKQRVIGHEASGFILKVARATAATDSFLINNPFAYLDDGRLYGAAFVADDKEYLEKDLARLRKLYFMNGFAGLRVFQQGESAGKFRKIAEYQSNGSLAPGVSQNET